MHTLLLEYDGMSKKSVLILIAFITGNSSLEPILEGLLAQIHIDLS